jgi:hypothetical protein
LPLSFCWHSLLLLLRTNFLTVWHAPSSAPIWMLLEMPYFKFRSLYYCGGSSTSHKLLTGRLVLLSLVRHHTSCWQDCWYYFYVLSVPLQFQLLTWCTYGFHPYIRGSQPDDLRQPHFTRQLTQ